MIGRTLKKIFHRVKKATKNIRFNKTKSKRHSRRHGSRRHGSRRHSRKQFGGENPFVNYFGVDAFIIVRPDEYVESEEQKVKIYNPLTKKKRSV